MKLLLVLALVALARCDKLIKSSSTTTTTTTTPPTTTTTAAPVKSDKEKRTISSEATVHNLDYYSPDDAAHTRYVTHEYLQLPATKRQQYVQIPASKLQQLAQYSDQKAQQQQQQQQYIHIRQPKAQQYVQTQNQKVQQYLQVQEPKVQQYLQAQEPKVQQYLQAQEPKVQQYLQVQEPKVQQYLQVQEPKVQQYLQTHEPKVQQYIQAREQKIQQYVQTNDPKVQQYVQAKEQQYSDAKEQQYADVPSTKTQQINYEIPETKTSQPTYTIQYVPAQHISHSYGVLPKFQQPTAGKQSQKYQFVSKTQKESTKTAAAAPPPPQNLVVPQQQYFFPSVLGYQDSFFGTPQYTSPGYNLFNTPAYQYVLPNHHQAPAQYRLQPVVMMFTLPGGHYLNTNAGQNALLTFLTGRGGSLGKNVESSDQAGGSTSLHNAATTVPAVPYLYHGQQVYLVPPAIQPAASHLVPQPTQRTTYSQQHVQQPAATSGSVQYRTNIPAQYQVKS